MAKQDKSLNSFEPVVKLTLVHVAICRGRSDLNNNPVALYPVPLVIGGRDPF